MGNYAGAARNRMMGGRFPGGGEGFLPPFREQPRGIVGDRPLPPFRMPPEGEGFSPREGAGLGAISPPTMAGVTNPPPFTATPALREGPLGAAFGGTRPPIDTRMRPIGRGIEPFPIGGEEGFIPPTGVRPLTEGVPVKKKPIGGVPRERGPAQIGNFGGTSGRGYLT